MLTKCENNTSADLLSQDSNAVSWEGEQSITNPVVDDKPAIAIPGIKDITFIADQKEQKINLHNPSINKCYFQMNLYAENELVWKSGYVAPGNGYYNIELNKTVSAGTMQGFLLIKCYKQDGTELNSAKVKFKITVVPRNKK